MVSATRLIVRSMLDSGTPAQALKGSRVGESGAGADELREAPTLRDITGLPEQEVARDPAKPSSALAHEVRNCLHRAVLHLMLLDRELERAKVGSDASEASRGVRKELTRISSAVDEYLDGLRSGDGEKTRSLRELCLRATGFVARQAAEAHLEIATELGGEVEPDVDLHPVERVLLHVLRSAVASATPHSRLLLCCHGAGTGAALELSWELPHPAAGAASLEETLDVVSGHGGRVEVRTDAERALVYVAFPVIAPGFQAARTT